MSRKRFLFVLALLAVLTTLLRPAECFPQIAKIHGRVTRVWDGDSINVKTERGSVEVRLAYIDAPEKRRTKARADRIANRGQPYGQVAGAALKYKIYRRVVRVDVVDIDRYGRAVGIVFCEGRDINLEMVREGYAWAYREYLGAPYASLYIDAEKEARRRSYGLWRQLNPEPPWEFRKRTALP